MEFDVTEEQGVEIRERIKRCSKNIEPLVVDPGKNNRRVAPDDAPFVPPLNHFQKFLLVHCLGNEQQTATFTDQVRSYSKGY